MQHTDRAAIALAGILCAALLAACSGTTGLPPVSRTNPVNSPASEGRLTIRFVVPKRTARRARYISPSTKAVQISITGANSIVKVLNLTKSSTLALYLHPGSNVISFTCYDSTNLATANVLSTAQDVPFTVVAGKNSELHVTLAGVPTTLYADSPYGNIRDGHIGLAGPGTFPFEIVAQDADGNAIVGPGTPAYSVQLTGAPFTVTQPTTSSPNAFTITATGAQLNSEGHLTLTASFAGQQGNGCSEPGAQCATRAVTVTEDPLLLVADSSASTVQSFGGSGGAFAIPFGTNAAPAALAEDREGDLYVADSNLGNVAVFRPPYYPYSTTTTETTPSYVISGFGVPAALLVDSDDNLYVMDSEYDSVSVYPRGSTTPSLYFEIKGEPLGMAIDALGDLAVADGPDSTAWIYFAPLKAGETPEGFAEGVKYAYSVAFDSSTSLPTLYIGNANGVQIDQVVPGGGGIYESEITSGVDGPFHVAVNTSDPLHQNYLFVANSISGTVTEYKPRSTSVFATYSSGISGPDALTFDATGNLYVGNSNGNVVEFPAGSTTSNGSFGIGQASALLWVP